MGLIQAIKAAGTDVLGDAWREYFYCDSLDNDTLMVKGQKRISGKSSNRNGADNIISNGSIIAVNEGQCMLIVEQGAVVDVCAEPGEFVYDKSTEPTIFYGNLGTGILETFKTIGKRFTFGGDTAKVYIILEIVVTALLQGNPSVAAIHSAHQKRLLDHLNILIALGNQEILQLSEGELLQFRHPMLSQSY